MDPSYSITSRLMQNYRPGTPVDHQKGIAATSDGEGNLLFFSIGTDGHVYAFSPAGSSTGWGRIDLSAGMDTDSTAVLIAAEQDDTGAPLLALVTQSTSTKAYSVYFTKDFTAATGASRWVFRGKQPTGTITNLTAGHGKDGAVMIVLTVQQGDQSTNYLVNPDLGDSSWSWREVPSPVNSEQVISAAIGHNSELEQIPAVQALLYSLHRNGGQTFVTVTSLPDFNSYNHIIPLDFSPTAMGVTRGPQQETELVVGATELYHLPSTLQLETDPAAVKAGLDQITPAALAEQVQALEVGTMPDGHLEAWYLLEEGTLYRSYQSDGDGWVSPLPFQARVAELTAWRSQDKTIANIFTVDLDDHLTCYRQDLSTTMWKAFDIAVEDLDNHIEISTYVTQLHVTDENGAPMPNQQVTVLASELTPLTINHVTYYVDPSAAPVVCQTDVIGNLTIVNEVNGLSTPILRLQGDVLGSEPVDVDPGAELRAQLSTITADDLQSAQVQTNEIGVTQPLFSGQTKADLSDASQALQQLVGLSGQLSPQGFSTAPASAPIPNEIDPSALPDGSNWTLGLSGSQLSFTASGTSGTVTAAAAATTVESVAEDVGHFFGDLWHSIEQGLVVAEEWVVQKADDGIHFVVTTAQGVYRVLLECKEQVWGAVQYAFQKIGAAFDQIVAWLGFVFSWKDILRTHDVIRTAITHGIDAFVGDLDDGEDRVRDFFGRISGSISDASSSESWGSWSQGSLSRLAGAAGPSPALAAPDTSWTLQHVTGGSLFGNGDSSAPSAAPAAPSGVDRDALSQVQGAFGTALVDLVKGTTTVGEFVTEILEALEKVALDAVEDAVVAFVDVLKGAVGAIRALLETSWDIPVLTSLYGELTEGSQLTLIDVLSLIAAVPATAMYKAAMGEAPFTDATATALAATTDMDDLLSTILSLDGSTAPASPKSSAAARPASLVGVPSPSAQLADPGTASTPAVAAAVRNVGYAFGFIVGASSIVNGLTNALLVALPQDQKPAAEKVKFASGLVTNVLSFVPMAIALHYAEAAGVDDDGHDVSVVRYEMYVTTFQMLFSAKDALAAATREPAGAPLNEILIMILDTLESILGGLNIAWFVSLAAAERPSPEDTDVALKTAANIATAVSQLLAAPGGLAKDPVDQAAVTVAQVLLGVPPGVMTWARTGIDIKNAKLEVIR